MLVEYSASDGVKVAGFETSLIKYSILPFVGDSSCSNIAPAEM